MYKIFEFLFVLGVCACALAATAGDVQEGKSSGQRASTVRFGDLNLETEQGVRSLYKRLRNAAEEVCGAQAGLVVLELKTIQARCVREAMANAVAKVNRPQLSAYHRTKTGVKGEQVISRL